MNIYEKGTLEKVTGETLRPGGLTLTEETLEYCQFSKGAKILDVGCGTGSTVKFLIENRGFEAQGLDRSSLMIKKGKAASPELPIRIGRAEDLPFFDREMDGIFMECCFSLFEDQDLALKEAYRVLKDHGKLIITDLYYKNESLTHSRPGDPQSCLHGAGSKESLFEKLNNQGFKISLWCDKSKLLAQLVIDTIMKYGSADYFWESILPPSENQGLTRAEVLAQKPGYFLLIATKAGAKRPG